MPNPRKLEYVLYMNSGKEEGLGVTEHIVMVYLLN